MKRILVSGLSVDIGGIGALLTNMVSCNKQIGNSKDVVFDFLVPHKSEYLSFLEKENYTYYEVPSLTHIISYILILKNIFRKNHYDYIWINNTSKVDLFLPLLAKRMGKAKVIQHSHGVECEEKGIKRLIFKLCEFLWGRAYENLIDVPLACSELSADFFYTKSSLRNSCLVLHNGIFLEKFKYNEKARSDTRGMLGIDSSEIILLGAVGRLTRVKNYSFLIELMSLLPQNYYCVIVGEGEDEDLLKGQIRELKLEDRVKLLGKRNDIPDLLCAMDLFVMPSLYEGLPFSIIEAQASGLRCLVSDGISEEANLFGNVTCINLSEIIDWKKQCLKTLDNIDRIQCNMCVKQSGYSIEESYESFIQAIN